MNTKTKAIIEAYYSWMNAGDALMDSCREGKPPDDVLFPLRDEAKRTRQELHDAILEAEKMNPVSTLHIIVDKETS